MRVVTLIVMLIFGLVGCSSDPTPTAENPPTATPAPTETTTVTPTIAPTETATATLASTETIPTQIVLVITATPLPATELAAIQESCPVFVETALNTIDELCATTGRNQVCYGNPLIDATLRENSTQTFATTGDLVDLIFVEDLRLSALDTLAQEWGLVLMKIQANLPETLPGQNVTVLLFGGTELRPDLTVTDTQAFYFQSGIGRTPACIEAPPDGMLVQTPQGVASVQIRVNNVDIVLGSTAFLEAPAGGDMTISVIEGQALVTAAEETQLIPAGTRTIIALNDDGVADENSAPSAPEPYQMEQLFNLPVQPLERAIEVAPAITVVPSATPMPEQSAIGQIITGSITEPGETERFSFTAEVGDRFYFDGQGQADEPIYWEVFDPAGNSLFAQPTINRDGGIVTITEAGSYTIFVGAIDQNIGDYQLQVWELPERDPQTIEVGQTVDGVLTIPGDEQTFVVDIQADQSIYFDGQIDDTGDLRWRADSASGDDFFSDELMSADGGRIYFEEDVTVTITIDGIEDATGTFRFHLWDVPPDADFDVTFGETISGELPTPGAIHFYSFEGEAGQVLTFAGLDSAGSYVLWNGGGFTETDEVTLFDDVPLENYTETVTIEEDGSYYVAIFGANGGYGDYRFVVREGD